MCMRKSNLHECRIVHPIFEAHCSWVWPTNVDLRQNYESKCLKQTETKRHKLCLHFEFFDFRSLQEPQRDNQKTKNELSYKGVEDNQKTKNEMTYKGVDEKEEES